MGEGLRPHWCQYFEDRVERYYDHKRGVHVKKVYYLCMICGRAKTESYDCYYPPPKKLDKTVKLNRNKHKHSK